MSENGHIRVPNKLWLSLWIIHYVSHVHFVIYFWPQELC